MNTLVATTGTRTVQLGELPTTTLERLLAQASLQTRVDRKYLLAADEVPVVLGLVDGEIEVLEIDRCRCFGYRSTYFDTPARDAFLRSGRGRRRRFKVRTRVYRDSGDTWLEVKTRGPRGETVKDRLPYDLADAGRLTPAALDFVAMTLESRGVTGVEAAELEPVLHTSYERATLLVATCTLLNRVRSTSVRAAEASRATVDWGLSWRRPGSSRTLSLPHQVVVETKGGASPSALDRALWHRGFRPSRISKYGAGLAALSDLPELKWHRVLHQQLRTMPDLSA